MVTALDPRRAFRVSDVRPARSLLVEVDYRSAVEAAVGGRVESCPSRLTGRLVPSALHGLLHAVHLAFADHRPLALSPDHVWLAVCQGVATHVNQNADALRAKLVTFDGRQTLIVRRDDFVLGAMENPWEEVWPAFVDQMREHMGPRADAFAPAFSTSGPVERAACQVTLMDSVKSYFTYEVETRCGIPSVTLEGTPADWQTLRERAAAFAALDLAWWSAALDNVLQQFHRASVGDVDVGWWQSLYKWQSVSGGAEVTGHLLDLFPYVRPRQYDAVRRKMVQETIRNPLIGGPKRADDGLPFDGILPGLALVPFVWDYLGRRLPYQFVAGFVGVRQAADGTVRPEIGWAVRPGGN